VGKYKVDLAGFEKAIVPILDAESDTEIFIIDEIGKMECLSYKFITAVRKLFASEKAVFATVAQKGKGLISEVKKYPGINLFHLEHERHERIITEILELLSFV
jgi:nucleoside-triphosphatase